MPKPCFIHIGNGDYVRSDRIVAVEERPEWVKVGLRKMSGLRLTHEQAEEVLRFVKANRLK